MSRQTASVASYIGTSTNTYNTACGRNALEDPWVEPSEEMFTRSVSPEQAPDQSTYIEISFEEGDPVAIDGVRLSPATLLTQLNKVLCSSQI